MEKAQVIVIFPAERERKTVESEADRSARKIFDGFTGSVKRETDEKAELITAKDEKYADTDRH